MYLRPYNKSQDFEYIKTWVSDARTHALWCAKLLPYPFTAEDFHTLLTKGEADWGDVGYIFMDDEYIPVGFCIYNCNGANRTGFIRFVVLNPDMRGMGYGTQMLKMLLEYTFAYNGVQEVGINVFDCNVGARKCYEKLGFTERSFMEKALEFEGESWGRYRLGINK